MCGIAGAVQRGLTSEQWQENLERMGRSLAHRGPDDAGFWADAEVGIGFAHRRLAIVDLSPEGHQPMFSPDGRFSLIYNGEIYNFPKLRQQLLERGHHFRGHSDTEIMLAAFCEWGVHSALERFIGMFAFALWDRSSDTLTLARDRLGEKPLYYGWQGNSFLFGSELKALRTHPTWNAEINRNALALYVRHNYIPNPYTIFQEIYKLPPATYLTLHLSGLAHKELPVPTPYWSAQAIAEAGQSVQFNGTDSEAVKHLDTLLRNAVAQQMLADVPLGAFLSGGIDSSTVVALMQAQSSQPVRTFSIGFEQDDYNEARYAKAVAEHLGTDHTELYVTHDEALATIPLLPQLYDEPFADSSQISTYLVSQLARQHVTVSLSGDGGDELFGGYNRYFWSSNIWKKISWMPPIARKTGAGILTALSPTTWDRVFDKLSYALPSAVKQPQTGDKLHKLSEILTVPNPEAMYLGLVSYWKQPSQLVYHGTEAPTVLTNPSRWANLSDFTHRMMYLDTVSYLPGDILVKVDRASMGASLESRVPMLDHRIVEFAWTLPLSMKVRNGQGKWILRQVLEQYVPPSLFNRPKMGFGVPIDHWLRHPLRDWAENLLDKQRLSNEGFFDPVPIHQKWQEHLSSKGSWHYYLWGILMFQAWQEHWK